MENQVKVQEKTNLKVGFCYSFGEIGSQMSWVHDQYLSDHLLYRCSRTDSGSCFRNYADRTYLGCGKRSDDGDDRRPYQHTMGKIPPLSDVCTAVSGSVQHSDFYRISGYRNGESFCSVWYAISEQECPTRQSASRTEAL